MSKFTSWFTPFLTKTAKFEPVNAGMRAMGMNKLADSRQHFETVAAPRAANQFVGAVSKPVTGLEKHYGPYHNDSGTAKTRNDASNHGGDIGAIVAALYFGGSAAAGAGGGGGGAGAGAAAGTEAGAAGTAGGTAAGGTAAMTTTEALYGTAGYGSGAGFAADGSVMAAGEGAGAASTAAAPAATAEGTAASETAGTSEASASEPASQAPSEPTPTNPPPTQAAASSDITPTEEGFENTNSGAALTPAEEGYETSTGGAMNYGSQYSADSGGFDQYQSDNGMQPDGGDGTQGGSQSSWQKNAKKYGNLMKQAGKAMERQRPSVEQSNVAVDTPRLQYTTSTRTAKTPQAASMQSIAAGASGADPIDANGVEMASIQALSKKLKQAKQQLAALEGKTK